MASSWSLYWVIGVMLLLAVFAAILQTLWGFYRTFRALRAVPGWPTHWLWGNLHQLKMDHATHLKQLAFVQEYGHKILVAWLGSFKPVIAITHCNLVQKVIKLPKDKIAYNPLTPWLGTGLLTAENKKWSHSRRLLTPAFHYNVLKGYTPVMNSCLEVLIKKWTVSAAGGLPVYTFRDFSKLTLDVLMRCAFSRTTDCQLVESNHYIQAVDDLVSLIYMRIHNPLFLSDFVYFRSSEGKRFKQACQVAHEHTESVIRKRKQDLGIDGALSEEKREIILEQVLKMRKYLDFLDILLTAQDEDGKGLTDKDIRDEADTFMLGGHDTVTSSMSWTLYCLAENPEHQDKAREEVRGVLMGREWLEYDDLKDLKYTTWCIKESLRLYPPLFEIARTTKEDVEIEGHMIPKGTMVVVEIMQVHRHPDTWENPNEYDPLRFEPSNTVGRHPYAYIPFSAGSRNCIGQNFALNLEKMAIASILNRFQVDLDKEHEIEIVPRMVLRTSNH